MSFEKRLQVRSAGPEQKDPEEARKAMRIRLQVLQGESDARLKAILTPEQMAKHQTSAGTGAHAKTH